MAEQTDIILNLKVDTDDSLNEIEKVEQKFAELEAQTIENGEVMAEMAKKIELYRGVAVKAGATSPIGQEAIKKAAELQGKLDEVNEMVNRNNTDFDTFRSVVGISQTAINSYGAFQAVSAIVGVENEKLLETMVKLQASQQLLNSLEQARQGLLQKNAVVQKAQIALQKAYTLAVGTSTSAMKAFRLALIATGIGALVVAVGLLIANWEKFTGWIQASIDKFEWLQPIVDYFVQQIEQVKAGLVALGIIDDEQTTRAIANAEAKVEATRKEEQAINERYDFEIAKAQATGKATFELEQEKRKALMQRIRSEAEALQKLAELNGSITDEQKERAKELVSEFKKVSREMVVAKLAQEKKVTDDFKKQVDVRKKEAEKEEQERAKLADEEIKRADEQFALMQELTLTAQEKEIADLVAQYDKKFELAEGNAELEKQLAIKQAEEIAEIDKKFADEKLMQEAEQMQRMRDLRLEFREATAGELPEDATPDELQAYYETKREIENMAFENAQEDLKLQLEQEALTQEEFDLRMQTLKANNANSLLAIDKEQAEAENAINDAKMESAFAVAQTTANILGSVSELAGENVAFQKTLAVAQIALDTAQGISGAIKAGAGLPFPSNLPAIASGVSAVLSGMVSAKRALSQAKTPKGGGISVPNFGGGGGGIGSSPSTTPAQTGGTPEGTLTSGLINGGQQQPTARVTVLESDISEARDRNNQSVQTSEL